ncbi:MAG: hypothetical protein H0W87_06080 [Actinobacteria bacterium]|nr:hypothetical protein [Actinomycetota bacterium]
MRPLFIAAAAAFVLLTVNAANGAARKVVSCQASILNTSGRVLELVRARGVPPWQPGDGPARNKTLEDGTLAYWSSTSSAGRCMNDVIYRSGRARVEITVDGRDPRHVIVRCRRTGFHRCEVVSKSGRPPRYFLRVILS